MMREEQLERGDPIDPKDWIKLIEFKPREASDGLGWKGLQAAHFFETPTAEFEQPVLTDHMLVLFARPPEAFDLLYEGVNRHVPPPPGSISVVPAGSPLVVRSSGSKDQLHIFLEPQLVDRVAIEAFDLDPARLMIPPLDGLDLPHLRSAMAAIGSELTSSSGGRLSAESLANVLAVNLIRQAMKPNKLERGRDTPLPLAKLRVVAEYVEENLETDLTLESMAAAVHRSAYHFARQFKLATGVPPHQYVILRRIERAQKLLHPDLDLPLAEIALRSGFSDQSQFTHHFKRIVGVTPRQFRSSARIA